MRHRLGADPTRRYAISAKLPGSGVRQPPQQGSLSLASVGSTMDNLNAGIVSALRIPLPPIGEQLRIVAHLDEQTSKIDALITVTGRFIELARERRSALITAAVTGQIDVRQAA